MEFFSRLFTKFIEGSEFAYHPKCTSPPITHICFADDLFLFCAPSVITFQLIWKFLHEFHKYSGLQPNGNKSEVYISGISLHEKVTLCSSLDFQLGDLPVKYLEVPLISTKLKFEDCKEQIDKITKRITSWSAKCLSYPRRLVLIKSVLFSFQIYWSINFILLRRVSNDIEQVIRRFLWSDTELRKWGSKVAWQDVCKPKNEGGLSIRLIGEWNKASMMRHIWALCSNRPSLWVNWCKSNLLKGRCFWEIKTPSNCSWTWRKFLKLRSEAICISKNIMGKGDSISLWFSNWHPKGPLIPTYGPRIAYDAGLPQHAKVSQVISNEQWKWPCLCTWELNEIILLYPPAYSPNPQATDIFVWNVTKE